MSIPDPGGCNTATIWTEVFSQLAAGGTYAYLLDLPASAGCGFVAIETDQPGYHVVFAQGILTSLASGDQRYSVNQELGHTLLTGSDSSSGNPHADGFECGSDIISSSCLTAAGIPSDSCTDTTQMANCNYGNSWDVMGNGLPGRGDYPGALQGIGEYDAVERYDLGWMTGRMTTITPASPSGSYTLSPLESRTAAHPQALEIESGGNKYFVEYRQPIGSDSYLSSWPMATDGVQVNLVNPIDSSQGLTLDMTPDSDLNGGASSAYCSVSGQTTAVNALLKQFCDWLDSPLQLNRTFVDPSGSFEMSVTGVSSTAATVSVEFCPCLQPGAFSYGGVQVGTSSATHIFTLENPDSSPVTVNSVSLGGLNPGSYAVTSDACTGSVIPARGSCDIAVAFRPKMVGTRTAFLQVNDSVGLVSAFLFGSGTWPCNGTWSVVASPDPRLYNQLAGVWGTDRSTWAVGSSWQTHDTSWFPIDPQALIEHWNGTSWRVYAAVNPSPTGNVLTAVSGSSASDVWAVGYKEDSSGDFSAPLVEHWNGAGWSVVVTPSEPGYAFTSVAVVSSTDVWAVGYSLGGQALAEHWNGTSWTVVATATLPAFAEPELYGVAAVGTNNVWAVGTLHGGGSPLAEHWNGTKWSIVPSASAGYTADLIGVAATPSSIVTAVGSFPSGAAFIEQTAGSGFVVPDLSGLAARSLASVSVNSATGGWAVGGSGATNVVRWNGESWTDVPSPSPGDPQSFLTGVRTTGSNAWAVGWTNDTSPLGRGGYNTLTEHIAC